MPRLTKALFSLQNIKAAVLKRGLWNFMVIDTFSGQRSSENFTQVLLNKCFLVFHLFFLFIFFPWLCDFKWSGALPVTACSCFWICRKADDSSSNQELMQNPSYKVQMSTWVVCEIKKKWAKWLYKARLFSSEYFKVKLKNFLLSLSLRAITSLTRKS